MSENVLITGASAGIGAALARLFAADGSNLVLVARRRERLEALAAELSGAHSVRADVLVQDLADRDAPRRIVEQLDARGVAVDVLVNNAGFGAGGRFDRVPVERLVHMVQVNVAALTELTRRLTPGMIARGRGAVLNVGSTAGFQPGPGAAVYFATKAYVLSLTEALYEELRRTGVTVTLLAPGATDTEFFAAAGAEGSRLARSAMPVEKVARAGYRGLRRGRMIVVPGLHNRLGAAGVRFTPRWLVRKIVKALH